MAMQQASEACGMEAKYDNLGHHDGYSHVARLHGVSGIHPVITLQHVCNPVKRLNEINAFEL